MKKIYIILLCTAAAVASGCMTVQLPKRKPEEKPPVVEAEPVLERGKTVAFEREKQRALDVVKAVEYSLSLETVVWENSQSMVTREDVLGVFRKGFSLEKAQEITDYVWIEAIDREGKKISMLNPGEPVLTVPNSIEVVESDETGAEAILHYNENLEGPVVWPGHTIVAILIHEDGTWKISETRLEE
jgi:hypothetical protein